MQNLADFNASSPMAAMRRSRIGCHPLYRPRDILAMLYGGWQTNACQREHVVEQPPTVMVIDDDPGVRTR